MREYREAKDVELIAREIIPLWHAELTPFSIKYLFTETLPAKGGKTVLARVKKAAPLEAHFANCDAIMEVAKETWLQMKPHQQKALVDHELCHLGADEDGNLFTRPHDLEEFACVVARHGLWKSDLVAFSESCGQLNLFGPHGVEAEGSDDAAVAAH